MMKSDYVETLIIGSDYISTLAAILGYEKKSSLALLHNFNFFQDPSYLSGLNTLEVEYLKVIGDQHKIKPLRDIDKYIIKAPYTFYFGEVSLVLGRDVKSNLKELMRKMPEIFKDKSDALTSWDELEVEHQKFLSSFAKKLYDLPQLAKMRKALFIDDYGYFQKLKDRFQPSFFKDNSPHSFYRAIMGLFDNYTPKRVDDMSCDFHLLNLLSNYYLVDAEKLNLDLLSLFKARGGLTITDTIESFSITGKKLEGARLKELGRTFHFEELIGVGQPRDELQLRADFETDSYQTVDFIFEAVMRFPLSLGYFDYIVKPKWLGTSIERLSIQHFSSRVVASFAVSCELKKSDEDALIDYLQNELEMVFRSLGFKGRYLRPPYLFNHYDWHYRQRRAKKMKSALRASLPIRYSWWTQQRQEFKNSRYIGQYDDQPMGKISLLHKLTKFV